MSEFSVEDLRRKADALRKEAGVIDSYPVPLDEIIDSMNYQWIQFSPTEKTADIAGAVDNAAKMIYTNAYDIPQRQRFTAAHEIGHAVLHGNENIVDLRITTQPYDNHELDANAFAAELLMPYEKFKYLRQKKNYTVPELAEFFSVSNHAVEVRISKLKMS